MINRERIEWIMAYLEYYLIGNSYYENSQKEFKRILKWLEEAINGE